jgi:hypothetical protein
VYMGGLAERFQADGFLREAPSVVQVAALAQ